MNSSKNTSLQMAFAIFVGMFVGSLIALRVERSLLWLLIGVVSGGIVGYISLEPANVWTAIRAAARGTRMLAREAKTTSASFLSEQLRIGPNTCKIIKATLIMTLGLLLGAYAWYHTPILSTTASWKEIVFQEDKVNNPVGEGFLLIWVSCISTYVGLGAIRAIVLGKDSDRSSGPLTEPSMLETLVYTALMGTIASPLGMCLAIAAFTVWGLIHAGTILRKTLIMVHSEERFQAGAYSMMGTGAMWLADASAVTLFASSIVGAAIGALGHRYVSVRFIKRSTT